jgi:hypothetical protein
LPAAKNPTQPRSDRCSHPNNNIQSKQIKGRKHPNTSIGRKLCFNIPQPITMNLLSLDELFEADNDILDVQQQ